MFVDGSQLALVLLAPDLGPLFLPVLIEGDVFRLRRRISGGRHLVRVVGVEPGGDALFLGEAGEVVVVGAL